jgi:hypothetical protein
MTNRGQFRYSRKVPYDIGTLVHTCTYLVIPRDRMTSLIRHNLYHHMIGHINEVYLRKTAKYYGILLTGTLTPCVQCTLAKNHNTPLPKHTVPHSTVPGERIFDNISHLSYPSIPVGGNKYWLLLLDDATNMVWSYFIKQKSDAPTLILQFLRSMATEDFHVKYIRLDNSGENQYLCTLTTENNLQLTYEYTAPKKPQQNGRIERKFAGV